MTREPVVTLNLLPTGPGVPRRMPIPEFKGNDLSMTPLPGGKRVLVWGSRSGAPLDFFIADLDTGQMKAIAQGGHAPFLFQSLIAPDGRTTVAISIPDSKGDHTTLEIMDLEGQRPVRRMDLGLREAVSGWTADSGGLLVWDRNRIPAVVERLDLASGRRTPVLKIKPQDPAGVSGVQGVFLANDGRTYVYNVVSRLSDLFLVQGLR